jgi:hypothetical protein
LCLRLALGFRFAGWRSVRGPCRWLYRLLLRLALLGLRLLRSLFLLAADLLLKQLTLLLFLAADLAPPLVDLRQRERDLRGLDLLGTPLMAYWARRETLQR